jgi:tetratricopeptide (TPR) repeat protein
MRRFVLPFFSLAFLVVAPAYGQLGGICPPNAPDELIVAGRIIAPGVSFDRYIEVLQLNESQLVGYGYTGSTGEYKLPEQPIGQYYIIVRIDGFKEHKERINVFGCEKIYPYTIFMEPEDEPIRPVLLDFSGEVKEVVDITDLKRRFPKKVIDEFENAREDRLRGDVTRARQRLEKIVRDAPDFYDARNVMGTVYLELKMFREAEKEYNIAHELNPDSAAPLVSLGSLYVQEAETSTNPDPGTVGVLLQTDLGVILDDARAVLEQAIKLKPDASFAHYLLGVAHYKSGNFKNAETSLRQALTIESRLRWARIGLANLYIRQNRWRDAMVEFDAYLAEFPKVSNRSEVQAARKKVAQQLGAPSE